MRARRPAVERFFGVLNIQGAKSAQRSSAATKNKLNRRDAETQRREDFFLPFFLSSVHLWLSPLSSLRLRASAVKIFDRKTRNRGISMKDEAKEKQQPKNFPCILRVFLRPFAVAFRNFTSA
jgi:hypothetical protein